MNQMIHPLFARETGIICVATPDELSTIREPHCAAAIWQRQPLEKFQTWLDGLASDQLPCIRTVLRPEGVSDSLAALTKTSGTPAGPARDMLVADIAELAAIFAQVMNTPYLRLRLDVVTTNACRKFHIDAVTARLICTYRGTGTQCGNSPNGSVPNQIFTVPTGAPMIIRGTRWLEQPSADLLHRSPPIEGSGETRLVLVLDPVADLDRDDEYGFH